MTRLANPTPLFLNGRGTLLDGGHIYVGTAGTDPTITSNQLDLFWDKARTIPAAQPLRTVGGAIVNGDDPAFVYLAENNYSQTVTDVDGALVSYVANFDDSAASFQAADADLTAIAALSTTTFGRSLLTLTNAAALKSAAGVTDGLAARYRDLPLFTFSGPFTFTPEMRAGAIRYTGGAAQATIDPDSLTPWGTTDVAVVAIRNAGTGALTIAHAVGVTLTKNGSTSTSDVVLAVGGEATLKRWAVDDWTLTGTGVS